MPTGDAARLRDPLARFALATFHTTLLLVALVLLGFRAIVGGGLLADLDTHTGLAAFGALWAITWWTHGRLLRALPDAPRGTDLLQLAILGGGVSGILFLWAFAAIVAVPALIASSSMPPANAFLSVLLVLAFGSAVSGLVGGIVGALFALVDLALAALVARAARPGRGPDA